MKVFLSPEEYIYYDINSEYPDKDYEWTMSTVKWIIDNLPGEYLCRKKLEEENFYVDNIVLKDQRDEKMSKFATRNKKAATNAAGLIVGKTALKKVVDEVNKFLPDECKNLSSQPWFSVLVANLIAFLIDTYCEDNARLQKASDILMDSAAVLCAEKFNVEDFLEGLLSNVKLPESE